MAIGISTRREIGGARDSPAPAAARVHRAYKYSMHQIIFLALLPRYLYSLWLKLNSHSLAISRGLRNRGIRSTQVQRILRAPARVAHQLNKFCWHNKRSLSLKCGGIK